jgi:aryl-alcohol dehydrogenase-like predicted oxidoreductase
MSAPFNPRPLGRSTLVVPDVCLGTMTFGEQTGEADAHSQLDLALASGVNFLDTAEMYAVPPRAETFGVSESIVGRWLKRQQRERIIVATKVAGPSRNLGWIRGGPPALDRANIRAAIDGSLQRLQTDYVDLYQLHWPERNQPMFGQWQFEPANDRECTPIRDQLAALGRIGAGRQGTRHRAVQRAPVGRHAVHPPRRRTRPAARAVHPERLQPAQPDLRNGARRSLPPRTGRAARLFRPRLRPPHRQVPLRDPAAPGRLTQWPGFGQRYGKPNVAPAVAAYAALAKRHGLTPTQLALGFTRSRWFVSSTIIGASTLAQLKETLPATQTPISAELLAEIDAIHLQYTNPAP